MLHVPLLWLRKRERESERIGLTEREGRDGGSRIAGSAVCRRKKERKRGGAMEKGGERSWFCVFRVE